MGGLLALWVDIFNKEKFINCHLSVTQVIIINPEFWVILVLQYSLHSLVTQINLKIRWVMRNWFELRFKL